MRALAAVLVLLVAGCVSPAAPDALTPAATPSNGPGSLAADDAAAYGANLATVATAHAPGGYALRVHEDRAYVATFTPQEGVSIFDVADPTTPQHLGGLMGTLARSVDVIDYGERVAVAISTGSELMVFDVTDPQDPLKLAELVFGSHNVQVHPTARVIYNARNIWDGVGGAMEIVDASDPENIHLESVWTFPPTAEDGSLVQNSGCHDFTIFPETERAYCAAYDQTLILDVADPLQPVLLSAIDHPLITVHHTAFPILDHTVLVIGDEFAANMAWGCPGAGAPAGTLWFFDLTEPGYPLLGVLESPGPVVPKSPIFLLPFTGPMCTSHNGMELGAGTGLIAYGWFHAGLALVDASDPTAPVLLDLADIGGAVGDARWHNGHVFAADDKVGLTVLRVTN